nr:PREDICTED: uncharacterized protein LOC105668376 [Linepithema humile]
MRYNSLRQNLQQGANYNILASIVEKARIQRLKGAAIDGLPSRGGGGPGGIRRRWSNVKINVAINFTAAHHIGVVVDGATDSDGGEASTGITFAWRNY